MGLKRIVSFICTMVVFLSCFFAIDVKAAPHTVKVGWFSQKAYQEVNEEGNPYGYNLDYLMRIAQYTDWKYEFVHIESFEECYNMLKNQEIDILGYVLHSPERAEEVLFSERGAGVVSTSIFTRDDSEITAYDFTVMDRMTIASIQGKNNDFLAEYAEKNGFEYELVIVDNTSDVIDAVVNGGVDAGLQSAYIPNGETRILSSFSSKPFYFAVSRNREDLLLELNTALDMLMLDDPYWERNLSYQYNPPTDKNVYFTKAELDFAKTAPPIDVIYYDDWFPISYINEKTGEPAGLAVDVLQRVMDITGLQFRLKTDMGISAGAVDSSDSYKIISCTLQDYSMAYSEGYRITNAFLNIPIAQVRRVDDIEPAKSTALSYHMGKWGESNSLAKTDSILFDTFDDCLIAVEKGEADQAILNTYAASYMLQHYSSLEIVPLYSHSCSLSMAVSSNAPKELLSLVNKAITVISESGMNAIVHRNTIYQTKTSLEKIISEMPPYTIAMVTVSLSIVVIVLILFLFVKSGQTIKIRRILYTDELTQSLSYKGFQRAVASSIKQGATNKAYLVDFDINHFGEYNALNGYLKGDEILRTIAKLSREVGHPNGCCCRLQGDHFITLDFAKSIEEVECRAEHLSAKLRERTGGTALLLSFGVYEISNKNMSIATMCDYALAAKRTVKGNYENYVGIYDEKLHSRQLQDVEILQSFDSALQNGEFIHYFQPKYNSESLRVVGAEALVRWISQDGIIIQPGKFITLLENNGLIARLDLHMFEQLCIRMSALISNEDSLVPISINFSRVHLYDKGFPERLRDIAEKHNVPTSLLEIEITETIFVDSQNLLIPMVERLHQYGFMVSMDDFGAGFSSLNALKDTNFDIIKLDRGFINSVGQTERGRKVIVNIVALAHDLKMMVVAEGVETEEQFEVLRKCGCDSVQGFYFSRPVTAKRFLELIIAGNSKNLS